MRSAPAWRNSPPIMSVIDFVPQRPVPTQISPSGRRASCSGVIVGIVVLTMGRLDTLQTSQVRGRWGVVDPSQQLADEFNLRTKPPTSELDIKDLAKVGGARLFVAYSMVARWLTMCRARSTISPQRSRILGCHWSWLTRQSTSRVNFPPMKSSELPRPEALCRKVCAISPMGL